MKKVGIFLMSTLLYFTGTAQYEQGDIDFGLGGGIGVYGGSTNDVDEVDTTGGPDAAAVLFNIDVNYAVIEELSIGVDFERNSFITQDDSTDTDSYGNSNNFKFNVQYRFVNSEKNCLALEGGIGMSAFKFGDNISNEYAKGSGLTYEFGLDYQHYFGENVGMFINVGYGGYQYKELRNQANEVWRTNNDTDNIEVVFSGVNIRVGLQIKI